MGSLALIVAVLSSALGGGTYTGDVDAPCDSSCVVRLVTADDGRSLTTRSIVAPPCDLAEAAGAFPANAPRGTPVRPDGSFRWRSRYQVVEGRFSADGRTASGTARFLGLARRDCSAATATFIAGLARHDDPNGTCEKLTKGRLDVAVFVRRTGCTKATRVVDAWRVDRDCVTTALTLRPCRAAGGAARRSPAAGCGTSPVWPAARDGRRSSWSSGRAAPARAPAASSWRRSTSTARPRERSRPRGRAGGAAPPGAVRWPAGPARCAGASSAGARTARSRSPRRS